MKNEQKIVELLAHMVRKVDQGDELLTEMKERIKVGEERIRQNEERLNNLDEISAGVLTLLRDLAKRSGETAELRNRIERLEKHNGL